MAQIGFHASIYSFKVSYMTVITVRSQIGKFNQAQRKELAETLTDGVLVPELGHKPESTQLHAVAKSGF